MPHIPPQAALGALAGACVLVLWLGALPALKPALQAIIEAFNL
jgi:hypothetical protein